ncbi:MAG: OmpA family protein [Candidatus Eisenbacteria bacterium]|nr:OmpA family protein [Candidatus Eisenbacteria bacterium]
MLLKRVLLATIVLTLFFDAKPIGAKESGLFYVTPYLGYHFFDDKRDLRDGVEAGLLVERMLRDNLGLEAGIGPVFTLKLPDYGDNVKPFALAYRLNANYYLPALWAKKFQPYLTAGGGGDYIVDESDGNTIGIDGGLGVNYLLPKGTSIRTEIRKIYLFGNRADWVATFGLSFPWGHKDSDNDGVSDDLDRCPDTPIGVKVDAGGCPIDSDGDGIPDYLDKCPTTPPGVKTDAKGCPLDTDSDGVPDYLDKCPGTSPGVKTDANGCPLDGDSDGVPDYLDKCPGTPKGEKVDASGCKLTVAPKDSDSDGIPDNLDKCPGTPAGVKTDARGCPLDSDSDGVPDYLDKCPNSPVGSRVDSAGCVTSVVLNIKFDSGKSVLKEEYYPEIKRFADFMNNNSAIKVEIQGHTDDRGIAAANMKLSEERANAVMKALVEKFGVPQDRISARGYGQTKPVETNKTPEGRTRNRRVEAVIVK